MTCSSETQLQTDHTADVAAYLCIQLHAGEAPQIHLSVCLFVDKCAFVPIRIWFGLPTAIRILSDFKVPY